MTQAERVGCGLRKTLKRCAKINTLWGGPKTPYALTVTIPKLGAKVGTETTVISHSEEFCIKHTTFFEIPESTRG